MPPIVVSDIEGTISDHRHREHLAFEKKWELFFSEIKNDPLRKDIWKKIKEHNIPVVLATGRPENTRKETEDWLRANGVTFQTLIMRKDGDRRSNLEVKGEIYDKLLSEFSVIAIYEDTASVISMLKEKGANVIDVSLSNRTGELSQ